MHVIMAAAAATATVQRNKLKSFILLIVISIVRFWVGSIALLLWQNFCCCFSLYCECLEFCTDFSMIIIVKISRLYLHDFRFTIVLDSVVTFVCQIVIIIFFVSFLNYYNGDFICNVMLFVAVYRNHLINIVRLCKTILFRNAFHFG